MAGIYVHIPFCKQACSYCDFYFTTHLLDKADFLNALFQEIVSRTSYLQGQEVETIYFGGGTPSQLEVYELAAIISRIRANYSVTPSAEITVEANPDNLTTSYLTQLFQIGVNRLSIGIQSFKEEDLVLMNRAHQAQQAVLCVELARKAGFQNISIDLIYGLPNATIDDWRNNISSALQLNPEHISAYNLTIEAGTPLAHLVSKGRVILPSDEEVVEQHHLLVEQLGLAGFEHYETSNFARSGFRSKHNSSYWSGVHYLGFGPSAHSFDGNSRRWNIANTKTYVKRIEQDADYFETETLSKTDRMNEFIMTGLRTVEGINLNHFESNFGKEPYMELIRQSSAAQKKALLLQTDSRLMVSAKGKVLLDGLTAELFFE